MTGIFVTDSPFPEVKDTKHLFISVYVSLCYHQSKTLVSAGLGAVRVSGEGPCCTGPCPTLPSLFCPFSLILKLILATQVGVNWYWGGFAEKVVERLPLLPSQVCVGGGKCVQALC